MLEIKYLLSSDNYPKLISTQIRYVFNAVKYTDIQIYRHPAKVSEYSAVKDVCFLLSHPPTKIDVILTKLLLNNNNN